MAWWSKKTNNQAAPKRRNADRQKQTRQQRREFERARALYSQSKFVDAALILEQIGLKREAVSMLETAGQITEAAAMLMRMERPNRAGVMLARHGKWGPAAAYFKVADMPLEAARCAREQGEYAEAADLFAKASKFGDAGECWRQLGRLRDAGQSFLKAGDLARAQAMYFEWSSKQESEFAQAKFTREEEAFLTDCGLRISGNQNTNTTLKSSAEILDEEHTIIFTAEDTSQSQNTTQLSMQERLQKLWSRTQFLAELSAEEREELVADCYFESFHEGEMVVRYGEQPTGFLIVETGTVRVTDSSPLEPRQSLLSGECFAAGWVLLDELSPATYIAKTPIELLVITKEQFQSGLSKNPTLARKLYKALAKQIRLEAVTSLNLRAFSRAS